MNTEPAASDAPALPEWPRGAPIPDLPYRPAGPRTYRPRIAVVGCGEASIHHLAAYREAGWEVLALCDRLEERARRRQAEFYPHAEIFTNHRDLLRLEQIDVLDAALPADPRGAVITDAVRAGKHILSEQPLATDLDLALRLIKLARQCGVKLAMVQAGRWAPHLSYLRLAVQAGLIGSAHTVHVNVNWPCPAGQSPRETENRHRLLWDFGLDWLDFCATLFPGQRAVSVFAQALALAGQPLRPPMLAQSCIQFEQGLASVVLDGHSPIGPREAIDVTGSQGTLRSEGEPRRSNCLELVSPQGRCQPRLEGAWFNDGFRGAMGELLSAIEDNREPFNSAENHLRTLELGLAAARSAETGQAQVPGQVRQV